VLLMATSPAGHPLSRRDSKVLAKFTVAHRICSYRTIYFVVNIYTCTSTQIILSAKQIIHCLTYLLTHSRSRNSSVGIETGYELYSRQGQEILLFSAESGRALVPTHVLPRGKADGVWS
jgi:hypothetical protein